MKKFIIILMILAFTIPLMGQESFRSAGKTSVRQDTTLGSKSFGRLISTKNDSLLWMGLGFSVKQIATWGDTIALAKLKVDTLTGFSNDSIFTKADMVFLQDVIISQGAGDVFYVIDSGGDTIFTLDANNVKFIMTDATEADSVYFTHNGTDFVLWTDAGTGKIDFEDTFEADSIRSENGSFVFSPTTDKTTMKVGVATDSLGVRGTSRLVGTVTAGATATPVVINSNGATTISVGGSSVGLSIDGNKTSGNLFQAINDNDGAAGDSSVQILPTGGLRSYSTDGHRFRMDGLGATFTQTKSLLLENQTAAAAGAQQMSPALQFKGFGWKTDATASSDSVKWAIYNLPVQGTSAPTSKLSFSSKIGAAAWAEIASMTSGGTFSANNGVFSNYVRTLAIMTESADLLNIRKNSLNESMMYFKGDGGAGIAGIGIGTTAPLTNSLTLGTKATQRDFLLTRENVPAGTDSSIYGKISSGVPYWRLNAADGDTLSLWHDGSSGYIAGHTGLGLKVGNTTKLTLGATANTSYNNFDPSTADNLTLGSSAAWKQVNVSDYITLGGKGQTAEFYISTESTFAGTDSSIFGTVALGVPVLRFNGSDGDQYQWSINTSDEAILQNAAGLTLDSGTALKLGTLQWDVVGTDSINGAQIAAGTVAATSLALQKDLVSGTGLDGGVDNILPGIDSDVTLNVLVDYDGGIEAVDDSLNIKLNGSELVTTSAGLAIAGTIDLDSLTTAKIRRASSPLTLDVTGSGNSYVEVIQDNYAGFLAVGRTTGTEYSMITVCDGGQDNHPGFWQMLSDDGNGNYHWHATDHVYRVAASLPADDDAGGFAIIDADDGTIGADAQKVKALNVYTDTLIVTDASNADTSLIYDDGDTTRWVSDNPIKVGTGSLIVPTSGAVTINGNLTVTGKVEQQIPDHLFCAAEDSNTTITIAQDSIWVQVTGVSDTLFKFLEKDGFSAYDDTIKYTGTNNAHIKFSFSIAGTGTNAKDWEVRIFNVTDNAEVLRKIKFTTTGATNFAGHHGTCYDINANTNDEYVMQIRCVTDDSDFTFYGGHILAEVVHY